MRAHAAGGRALLIAEANHIPVVTAFTAKNPTLLYGIGQMSLDHHDCPHRADDLTTPAIHGPGPPPGPADTHHTHTTRPHHPTPSKR